MRGVGGDEGAVDGRDEVSGPVELAGRECHILLIVAGEGEEAECFEGGLGGLPVAGLLPII